MPLVKRTPRKLMKLIDAAKLLQVSRQTVKNVIRREALTTIRRPTRTSPIKLYEADVQRIAQEWGIL